MAKLGICKYCGTELSDYREFCNEWCRSDFEEAKADQDREDRQFEFKEGE